MTTNQTSELMSSIYEDLRRGVSSWEVWKEINNQRSRHPAGHFEFFDPVQVALLDSVLLAISRVLDKKPKAMGIPNLMKTGPALCNIKLKDAVDDLLRNYKPTIEKIAQRRNQYIAHSQGKNKRNPNSQLNAVDIDNFISSIVDTFREIRGCLQCTDYEFDHVSESRKRETTKVMKVLQEDWENRSPGNRSPLTG